MNGHNVSFLTDKYISLVIKVNNSKTKEEHLENQNHLNSWMEGVKDSNGVVRLVEADLYYLNQGIDRPMCCGVFLDWRENEL